MVIWGGSWWLDMGKGHTCLQGGQGERSREWQTSLPNLSPWEGDRTNPLGSHIQAHEGHERNCEQPACIYQAELIAFYNEMAGCVGKSHEHSRGCYIGFAKLLTCFPIVSLQSNGWNTAGCGLQGGRKVSLAIGSEWSVVQSPTGCRLPVTSLRDVYWGLDSLMSFIDDLDSVMGDNHSKFADSTKLRANDW